VLRSLGVHELPRRSALTIARFARRERRHKPFVITLIGAIIIVFTLIVNLGRGKPPGIASTRATEHEG
jgi:hypothetical protein